MEEIVEEFFDRSFEEIITEGLFERDYIFPQSKVENYVLSLVSIPYQYFIDYVCTHYNPKPIENADIPQISSYEACTRGVCQVMKFNDNPGMGYLELGKALFTDDIIRNDGALLKFGENHVKGASFHGLTHCCYKKWFLTCLGYIYPDLDDELRQYLSARTLLRNPFFHLIISESKERDVNIKKYMSGLSLSTQVRRSSSCMHFFNIIKKQCQLENVSLHAIYFDKNDTSLLSEEKGNNFDIPKEYKHITAFDRYRFFDVEKILEVNSNALDYAKPNQHLKSYDYSDNDILKLFIRYRSGDDKAFNLIIESCQNLVTGIAQLYKEEGLSLEDIIQEGNIGLIKAIKRFDHLKYHSFKNYAKYWILQGIMSYLLEYSCIIKIPLNKLNQYRKVQKFKEIFEQKNGFEPSLEDIDIDENIPINALRSIFNLPERFSDVVILSDNMDNIEDDRFIADKKLIDESTRFEVLRLVRSLSQREIYLLEAYYGLNGTPSESMEEIGKKTNLTRERVRQIIEKAIRRIKLFLGRRKIKEGDNDSLERIRWRYRNIKENQFELINPRKKVTIEQKKEELHKEEPPKEDVKKKYVEVSQGIPSKPTIKLLHREKTPCRVSQETTTKKKESCYYSVSTTLTELRAVKFLTQNELKQCHHKGLYTIGDVKKKIQFYNLTLESTRFTKDTLDLWFKIVGLLKEDEKINITQELDDLLQKKHIKYSKNVIAIYTRLIDDIRQNKQKGEVIIAKPVLLLAVIDGIDDGEISSNCIKLNNSLEKRYNELMQYYTKNSQFKYFTPINYPFWHLQNDGFWHILLRESPTIKASPTTNWLRNHVLYAFLDGDFWKILQNTDLRQYIKEYIIATKLE